MKPLTAIFHPWAKGAAIREEAAFWGAGLVFTFALFFALAHVESVRRNETVIDIEDVPVVSLPPEPPPPPLPAKVTPSAPSIPDLLPLSDIDGEASDSPVKVAVVPPDLEAMAPSARIPPQALVTLGFRTAFHPPTEVGTDFRRVYQETEVDQRPHAVVRVAPRMTAELVGTASSMGVTLLVVIDVDGRAASAQVLKPSGKPVFDDLVVQTVKDSWLFSPAIRRGRKVKCIAEQAVRVTLSGGSPFDVR